MSRSDDEYTAGKRLGLLRKRASFMAHQCVVSGPRQMGSSLCEESLVGRENSELIMRRMEKASRSKLGDNLTACFPYYFLDSSGQAKDSQALI